MGNRLKALSEGTTYPVPLMRYLLNKSIINDWADVFELKESDSEDFHRCLAAEYGIAALGADAGQAEYF